MLIDEQICVTQIIGSLLIASRHLMCRELIISLVLISCGFYVVLLLQAMSYQTLYVNAYITIDVQCHLLLMTGNLPLSLAIGLWPT